MPASSARTGPKEAHGRLVLITAATLINRSFLDIRRHFGHSFNMLVGPSTPLSPILFEHGLHALCATVVTDPPEARRWLSQGVSYRDAQGLCFVTLLRDGGPC